MAIPYSLALRLTVPGEPESENKTYPVAQYAQNLSLSDMAKHMANHGGKYNRGDIVAVTTQLVDCLREQLLLGNRITLGDLGTFFVSLKSEGADNAESFSVSNIKAVNVRWSPSKMFKSLINEATFTFVGTREAQSEARKSEIEKLNQEATIKPGESRPDDEEEEGGLGD